MTDPAELARRLRERAQKEAFFPMIKAECTAAAALIETQAREIAELRAALTACASQFQFYAGLHAAAGKPEKAATNQSFADLARSALAAGGKP